mmetsp:Transcript_12193/g.23871  ORF Transcript_12193/g.23871 Transcript_12193/m.23871 type:complete len:128 (+) Transcript_12193:23-406(+)
MGSGREFIQLMVMCGIVNGVQFHVWEKYVTAWFYPDAAGKKISIFGTKQFYGSIFGCICIAAWVFEKTGILAALVAVLVSYVPIFAVCTMDADADKHKFPADFMLPMLAGGSTCALSYFVGLSVSDS